jgi:hypothetical protein
MNNQTLCRALILCVAMSAAPHVRALDLEEAYGTLHQSAADYSAANKAKATQRQAEVAAPPAEDETCEVCWNGDFKPLNDKARSVKAWEDKRLQLSVATPIAGFAVLGALLAPDQAGAMEDGMASYMKLKRETESLQSQAVSLGGLEIKNGLVRLKIVKGVDYVFEQHASK